eukprot:3557375-Heterocapsa_arctica.AAC.1
MGKGLCPPTPLLRLLGLISVRISKGATSLQRQPFLFVTQRLASGESARPARRLAPQPAQQRGMAAGAAGASVGPGGVTVPALPWESKAKWLQM